MKLPVQRTGMRHVRPSRMIDAKACRTTLYDPGAIFVSSLPISALGRATTKGPDALPYKQELQRKIVREAFTGQLA